MNRAALFVPLALFLVILAFGYAGFQLNDPKELPSALLGKPFPAFTAPRLEAPERTASRADLLGEPVLVTVWATWCPTCRAENAELLRIGEATGLRIVGINYKDDPEQALDWLARYGNPFEFNVRDTSGQLGVELGVYGAPESFLLDAEGTIVYKRVGDVNPRIWRDELAPALAALPGAPDRLELGAR